MPVVFGIASGACTMPSARVPTFRKPG
jgi:hypothetical protein